MPDLDWQILDEGADDSPEESPAAAEPSRPERSRWPTALLALLALGVFGAIFYAQVLSPVEQARTSARDGALSGHQAVQTAVASSDGEAFAALLSGSDQEWARQQRLLFDRGLLPSHGVLEMRAAAADPRVVAVDLSRDLDLAQILTEQTYSVNVGNGRTETMTLQRTDFYRLEDERWLWSPPPADFWGMRRVVRGRRLTVSYPDRDKPIAQRLAGDLDALLVEMCTDLAGIRCPDDLHVELRLQTDPLGLTEASWGATVFGRPTSLGSIPVDLPTPTLAGLPLDEAGYQAFYRGYGLRVAKAAFASAVDWQASDPHSFYHAALGRWLIESGLRPWPVDVTGSGPDSPPIPFPDQDILIACAGSLARGGELYRYSPASGVWSKELAGRRIVWLWAMPRGDSLVFQERVAVDGQARTRTVLRRDGEEIVLADDPSSDAVQPFAWAGPSGEALMATGHRRGNGFEYSLFDLPDCTSTDCASTPLPGGPRWSPDGAQMLVRDSRGVLLRGDGRGEAFMPVAENGFGPVWLDSQTYAYFRPVPTSSAQPATGLDMELVRASVADDIPHARLNVKDLVPLTGDNSSPTRRVLFYAATGPADDGRAIPIVLTLTAPDSSNIPGDIEEPRAYLFVVDPQSGEGSLRAELDAEWPRVSPSPGGRWLAFHTFSPAGPDLSLHLHDVERDATQAFTVKDPYVNSSLSYSLPLTWSADGQWLLALADGVLVLTSPAQGFRRAVVPPTPGCHLAGWGDR